MKAGGRIRSEFSKVSVIVTLMVLVLSYIMAGTGISFIKQQADLMDLQFIPSLLSKDQSQSGEELARGKFLVASRKIKASIFAESVVLLVDYNFHSTMGLILNKQTGIKLFTVLPDVEGLREKTDTVFVGGPVAGNEIAMLIRSKEKPENSKHLFEDIYFSSSKVVLQKMVDDNNEDSFHLFAGYSGWAPGQLERELSRGDWHVMEADAEFVFGKEPSEIWNELIRRTSVRWAEVNANENVQ